MPNAPKVSFNIVNLSFTVAQQVLGISCVEGITLRGPFARPDLLIGSWPQFVSLYGGYIPNSDFPLLCKRAFDMGAQLRVNRQGHYATITNASTLDAVKADVTDITRIAFSAALITSNVYNLTINGTAISAITFATDNNTTMNAIVVAIKAVTAYVKDAWVDTSAAGSGNRNIYIVPKSGVTLALTLSAVTLGASQATTTISIINDFTGVPAVVGNAANNGFFTPKPKYHGVDYNNISIVISAASNGNANYFNMSIVHAIEPSLNETYTNLFITGNPTAANSTYLNDVKLASQLLDFDYRDLSATTGQQVPNYWTYYLGGGSDGTAPVAADYVGDAGGQNGFNSFDVVDDAIQFAAPELSDNTVHIGGAAYAEGRKDMLYIAHLSNASTTSASYNTARQTTNVNSYFTMFVGGGLLISDPVTGLDKQISEVGDVLGIMAVNDDLVGPWGQPAGITRGAIKNVLGVVNNFGTSGKYNSLNSMSNQQVNMVVNSSNQVYLNSANTAIQSSSKLSFVGTVRFLIWLQKTLAPTLKRYLQEPGDIATFKALYLEVKPFFDDLVVKRALNQYSWQGDQDVKNLQSLIINNTNDLGQGKYRVRLYLDMPVPLQEITVDLVVTASNVTLE